MQKTTVGPVAVALAVGLLSATSFGDDTTASDVLAKVEAAYRSMQTYKAEGTITSDIDFGGRKMNTVTSFSILLKKPNLYLISWTQKNMPMPGMVQSGAVWSDGTQPYLYMGVTNSYSKITTDEMALASATGISGGAAFTVPSLFLSAFRSQSAPFSRLKEPKIEKVEKIGDEECYVVGGPSVISKRETFWISKDSYVIRKYERSLEPPEGKTVIPEMTDEQLEESLKATGQEVTEEGKKKLREMMDRSRRMLKNTKLKGTSLEHHETTSFPELAKTDFKYAIPKGTVLKESLFGGLFSGNKSPSNKRVKQDKQ